MLSPLRIADLPNLFLRSKNLGTRGHEGNEVSGGTRSVPATFQGDFIRNTGQLKDLADCHLNLPDES